MFICLDTSSFFQALANLSVACRNIAIVAKCLFFAAGSSSFDSLDIQPESTMKPVMLPSNLKHPDQHSTPQIQVSHAAPYSPALSSM